MHVWAQIPDATRILRTARILAADSLEGRGTGMPGGDKAARLLVDMAHQAGLLPAGTGGSWVQQIPIHISRPLKGSALSFRSGTGTMDPQLWDDFLVLSQGHENFTVHDNRLVFVGYGIVAPEYDYSDYGSADVRGAILVMLAGEPPSDDPAYFLGARQTIHSSLLTKQQTALARGARGTIIIPTPRQPVFGDWEKWVQEFSFEDVRFPFGTPEQLNLVVRQERGKDLLELGGVSWDAVLRDDAAGSFSPQGLAATMSYNGKWFERDDRTFNVAAFLEGSDPLLKDTYVLVGAHYDHLGIGGPVRGDSIYNGMLDNAIGTATALECARVLARETPRLSRSVIFVFFTGEEKGLLGSRYYVDRPLVPLSKTIAMLNVDGISFVDELRSFIPIGSDYSTIDEHVRRAADRAGVGLDPVPTAFLERDPLFTSDHWSFMNAGVPSVLLSEGLTYVAAGDSGVNRFLDYGRTRYHMPGDDAGQTIDQPAVSQHASLLCSLIIEIANTYTPPQWKPDSPFIRARLRSIAEGK